MKTLLFRLSLCTTFCILLCHCGVPYTPQGTYYASSYPQHLPNTASYPRSSAPQGYPYSYKPAAYTSAAYPPPQHYSYQYATGNYAPQAYPNEQQLYSAQYARPTTRCATPRNHKASIPTQSYRSRYTVQPRTSRYRIPTISYNTPPVAPGSYYTGNW
jgi:hypothetical protein